MKTHVVFLSCLCSTLAITVHYQTTGSFNNSNKAYKTALKDIRLVPINPSNEIQEAISVKNEEQNKSKPVTKPRGDYRYSHQVSSRSQRGNKNKFNASISRSENPQNEQDPNHQYYMQKMANQLYMAQKHASVLSEYQKFIINQDPDVKNFVLTKTIESRTPKPFGSQRNSGRARSVTPKYVELEPLTSRNDNKKVVVVTPKVQAAPKTIVQPPKDYLVQDTQVKYVTLAPQPTTAHYIESQQLSPKVTLVPYLTPQPYAYYDVGATVKPHIQTVQVPVSVSLGLKSYAAPQYQAEENDHEEDHDEAKYEFMYNVKDHEKHNHFGHKESRTDKTTYGYYFVHLPDGRIETVKYWADKTGYHAKVDYQGEAKHPIHSEHTLNSQNLVHH